MERISSTEQGRGDERVSELRAKRRAEAESMIEEGRSVTETLEHFDNDYGTLAEVYRERVGCDLICNPYESHEHEIPITKSCSIVIPAYNNAERLRNCLAAVQASTFNAKYPQLLEVVVVDDGSPSEDIASAVEAMGLDDLNVRVLRQSNGRAAKARYSGVLYARNDIVIMTDPDVVYTQSTIEEYMKRHEILDGVVFFGLRDEIDPDDERLNAERIGNGSLEELSDDISRDPRVKNDGMSDSAWLCDSGHNVRLPIDIDDDRYRWRLPSIAWSMSLSASRKDLLQTYAGFDERYLGYGGEDEDLVSRLIATGHYVIPNTGGLSYHQRHPFAGDDQGKREINQAVLRDNLASSLKYQGIEDPERTDAELKYDQENSRNERREPAQSSQGTVHERASIELKMGNYAKAHEMLESICEQDPSNYWTRFDLAVSKIAIGGKEMVMEAIGELTFLNSEEQNTWVYSKLAEAYGILGNYNECRINYRKSRGMDPGNEEAETIDEDRDKSISIGKKALKCSKYRMAVRYFDSAIAASKHPENLPWEIFDKGVALASLGNFDLALENIFEARNIMGDNTWIDSRIGMIYERTGKRDKAEMWYRSALKLDDQNIEAREGMERLGL